MGEASLEASLRNLIKQRASQLNGCAYCLDMHAKDARAAGEDQQRLDVLQRPGARSTCSASGSGPPWRSPSRSRWWRTTMCPTRSSMPPGQHFSDRELAELVFTLVVINAWNRIAITSRVPLPPA